MSDETLALPDAACRRAGRHGLAMAAAFGLVALLLASALLSVRVGAVEIGLHRLVAALIDPGSSDARDAAILWAVRLPRTAMALLAGSALAASGAVMQGLFRNPLADPGLTGVSSGAALAAVATIVLGQNRFGGDALRWLPLSAFIGGLAVTALLYALATRSGRTSVTIMLLGGIAIGAIAMAATGLLIFISSEQQLRELTFWSMGSLAGASWPKAASLLACVLASGLALPLLTRNLDRLSLGEEEARYMGVNVERTKLAAIVVTALLTGVAVSVSGIIGFVGLVVPHMLRLTVGPSHRVLLPLSCLLGGSLMIIADVLARTVVAPAELPIGIVMACIGGPAFLWMLLSNAPHDSP